MEELMGLLRIMKRGMNLPIRDVGTSDPYIVITMDKQRLKTKVIDATVNPVWNEDLTLSITDANTPIKLTVYDRDVISMDDEMGDAEFDTRTFIEALRMNCSNYPDGSVLATVQPSRVNCLAEERKVYLKEGRVLQDLCLRLRNVESGEVVLQLEWINIPGCKGVGSK